MKGWIGIGLVLWSTAFAIDQKGAEDIAVEAYVYGYPLVTMDQTRKVMTNVKKSVGSRAPMGQFAHARRFPTPAFKDVTTPNADTLYSFAWLDLREEPYVLQLPNVGDRYYLMPILSGWTDVFADPGTRTTGNGKQSYVIVGPDWKKGLPPNITPIRSPTNLVWILGRTYSTGTTEDYYAVHTLQRQYKLIPLSALGTSYKPPKGTVNPKIDMRTPVRDQVNQMSGVEFFTALAALMEANPPAAEDGPIIAKMREIGVVPGEVDLEGLDPVVKRAIERAPQLGLQKIKEEAAQAGKEVNGWVYALKIGRYGTDYLQRALVAEIGLGANIPEDAIYPYTQVDSDGQPLVGTQAYVLHFPKGQTPPVKGFWSLTLYDDQYFFAENDLHRYNIGSRNDLQYNEDGSLDLYVQPESPGEERESNWLPSPEDNFVLVLRLYWPTKEVLDETWKPPAVKRA